MMWYARELGLACLAAQTADTEKIAREQYGMKRTNEEVFITDIP